MITGLDHVLLVCPSIDDGEAVYTSLLGRQPDWQSHDNAGSSSLIFQIENTALEIMAPTGSGPLARRLHAMIDQDGPGLKSLIFATDDIAGARGTFDRRALKPDEITESESIDSTVGKARYWSRFRIDEAATHGVRIFVLQRKKPDPIVVKPTAPASVAALDHVVINTAAPERAAALFGARLGLRLALDRSNPDWDMRLMFFRIGDVTIELAHKISAGHSEKPDKLWGLSWRVPDIEAAHARLIKAGYVVSEIRPGRRPGSKVFTVKDGTMGVPTLILSAEPAS
jgi:catechol 2,3-dioxygenase-like lactoylglutathione lyase family enzyme